MKRLLLSIFVFSSIANAQDSTGAATATTATPTAEIQAPATSSVTTQALTEDEDDEEHEAAVSTSIAKASDEKTYPKFEFKSYGYMVFGQRETFKTVQNLTPITRREMDLAEIAFEGEYILSESSKIEFEIEIEHGGVGTVIEFDPFEEFGEFEQEIEKGGEVVLPELYYKKTWKKTDTALRVGKFPLFIALGSVQTKPHMYASILASDLEARMIPLNWTEMGVQVEQKFSDFTARLGIVSGLNSEFFRTYNWIGGGYQRHFETNNADDLATLASLEWGSVAKGKGFALSYYAGNTTGNRYKVDKLKEDAEVTLWTLMGGYKIGGFGFSGEMIQGTLENSNLVSAANATLGGLAKPKSFAPLGHKARLESLQVYYDFASIRLTPFLKWEHVNTFDEVEGNINKNPRYEVTRNSGGLMWFFDTGAFLKAQYATEVTELDGLPETYQANIAFGFDIDSFNK
ncbi:MAG: hypothetical protein OM95_01165 [Bdellovibrio sp. ArHS]|uniref:hypothetical protein n=1 Tax=Bdellovibrio sp. ArHS TaxID=1569284 RepID=UPI0005833573|nr:hypothetical protein [Bdellovibrio sp. ArHS]KHD89714.1 MAG: hypothetical protein OM95_01165 [Bdellovibrio sp. ArHS]